MTDNPHRLSPADLAAIASKVRACTNARFTSAWVEDLRALLGHSAAVEGELATARQLLTRWLEWAEATNREPAPLCGETRATLGVPRKWHDPHPALPAEAAPEPPASLRFIPGPVATQGVLREAAASCALDGETQSCGAIPCCLPGCTMCLGRCVVEPVAAPEVTP